MFRISRLSGRAIRTFRSTIGAAAPARTISHPRAHSRWEKPSTRNRQFPFAISSLTIASTIALTGTSFLYAEPVTDTSTLSTEDTSSVQLNADEAGSGNNSRAENQVSVAKLVLKGVMAMMDPYQKALLCGITGINVAVSSAFLLGFKMNKPPNRKPALFRFMCRNFILSQGWLKRGRFHVVLTCMFTHLFARHLITNTLLGSLVILGCSQFLSAGQIAGLYVGGGLVGGTTSISLCTFLRKHRYMSHHTGASDGLLALGSFLICAADLSPLFVPYEPLLLRGLFVTVLLQNVIGFRKFLRYGYKGRGKSKVDVDYTAHLAGVLTGLAAYVWKVQ